MPRIPEYQNQANKGGLPGARQVGGATPQAFGSGIGQAIQSAGNLIQGEALELQIRNDTLKAKKAYRNASRELTTLLRDPENGMYSTRRGENATNATKDLEAKVQEIQGKYSTELSGRQKEMFNNVWFNTAQNEIKAMSRHEFSEFQNTEDLADAALQQQSVTEGIGLYNDPKAVNDAIQRGMMSIESEASRKSLPVEAVQAKRLAFTSKMHSGIIEKYLSDNNTAAAKNHYEKNKDAIDSRLHSKLERGINHDMELVESQQKADSIFNKYGIDNMEDALKEVGLTTEGKMRDMVQQRVLNSYRLAQIADQERFNSQMSSVLMDKIEGKAQSDNLQLVKSFRDDEEKLKVLKALTNIDAYKRSQKAVDRRDNIDAAIARIDEIEELETGSLVSIADPMELIQREVDNTPLQDRAAVASQAKVAMESVFRKRINGIMNNPAISDEVKKVEVEKAIKKAPPTIRKQYTSKSAKKGAENDIKTYNALLRKADTTTSEKNFLAEVSNSNLPFSDQKFLMKYKRDYSGRIIDTLEKSVKAMFGKSLDEMGKDYPGFVMDVVAMYPKDAEADVVKMNNLISKAFITKSDSSYFIAGKKSAMEYYNDNDRDYTELVRGWNPNIDEIPTADKMVIIDRIKSNLKRLGVKRSIEDKDIIRYYKSNVLKSIRRLGDI
jgi:hypothetical protein